MKKEMQAKILASLYDRLADAVTYAPDGKSSAYPGDIYFQMTKYEVLNPDDFRNMMSPANPNGDRRMAEFFSQFTDRLPTPAPLWSDSTRRLSLMVEGALGQANTTQEVDPAQEKIYHQAFDYLNTEKSIEEFDGSKTTSVEPTAIALAYEEAKTAYAVAVGGYRTAYNGYDLDKIEDQRAWSAAEPMLSALVESKWNAWTRAGKAQVEKAQNALSSTINNAVSAAIAQQQKMVGDGRKLPSALPAGDGWLPSYAAPSNWAEAQGVHISFKSSSLDKTETSRGHSFGSEASGSYGLFHAAAKVEGKIESEAQHLDAESFELEAELLTISILRPWYNPLLLGMTSWWVDGIARGGLSNGDPAGPAGQMALVPTAFVVARNVAITADFTEEDKTAISKVINSELGGGWGPFTLKGKYGYSASDSSFAARFDGGKLIFPGLQVIGWISTVPPLCPPQTGKQGVAELVTA
ncbi:hypothetical protein [Poseidonocella sp. HB161398]|uniref:hypothetical protein n=1 Tax=Poseidonocella sp. HB161398 TaxID=2320855 RepID=UPI001107BF2F|nr:hypothetical protein [Poseidonocella sp. HB161398]